MFFRIGIVNCAHFCRRLTIKKARLDPACSFRRVRVGGYLLCCVCAGAGSSGLRVPGPLAWRCLRLAVMCLSAVALQYYGDGSARV